MSSGRRSISGSTSATRSCHSENTAESSNGSERRIDSPRRWGTGAAWAGCRPTWRASSRCWVNRSGRLRRRSAPSRWPSSTTISPSRSRRHQCSARLTMPRARTRAAPMPCAETSPPSKASDGRERLGLAGLPRSRRAHSSFSVSPRWGSSRRPRCGAAEALRLAEAADHPYSLAHALFGVGHVCLRQGDLNRAIAVLERGLRLCDEKGIRFAITRTTSSLGHAYALSGRVGRRPAAAPARRRRGGEDAGRVQPRLVVDLARRRPPARRATPARRGEWPTSR